MYLLIRIYAAVCPTRRYNVEGTLKLNARPTWVLLHAKSTVDDGDTHKFVQFEIFSISFYFNTKLSRTAEG